MNRITLFRIKNAMLLFNGVVNGIGVCVVLFLTHSPGAPQFPEIVELANRINYFFLPCAFLVPTMITVLYEHPIRQYMNRMKDRDAGPVEVPAAVHQRLLNEPFFLIGLDLCIWLAAALLYPLMFWAQGAEWMVIQIVFVRSFITGLITITVAFFVFEFVLQRRVVPHFFPNGGLYGVEKTFHIRIRTRLIALLFACNIIPFLAIIIAGFESMYPVFEGPAQALEEVRTAIFANSLIFMGVGIWLTFLVSTNLTKPLQEIIRVLRGVRHGQFDRRVSVTSNDEIGYAGDVINEMNEGLKERDFIKETFGKYVTQEVRDEVLSGRIPLDGEVKEVTILFADLRDFTPMTESNDPKLMVRMMNQYFKEMAEAIQHQGGLVLQFLGDEIYAVFGAPVSRPDHPARAFRAGLEMSRRLQELNRHFREQEWPTLRHGIGIHTGEALAANIGSPDRLSYLLVGDTVNLASRLQGLTKELGTEMILSKSTLSRLEDQTAFRNLGETRVKGRSEPVEIYTTIE